MIIAGFIQGIILDFYLFVSKRGVEEVKLQLVNPANKNYTIIAIAKI
jgi:hypothetical protein